MADRKLEDVPTAARQAIEAQLKRYDEPGTPCEGLHSYRILSAEEGGEWGATGDEICVHFYYVREGETAREEPGLEVTIYEPNGSGADSQDYG